MKPVWRTLRGIAIPIFTFAFGIKVRGLENFPRQGGVIICSNHGSWWDPVILGVVSPRDLYYVARHELFIVNRFFGYLIRKLNAFPVRRDGLSISSLRKAKVLLEEGKCVVIFPEGGRNRTGKPLLTPLKEGAGFLSKVSDTPILPCYIKNNRAGSHNWFMRRKRLEVIFGPLINPRNFKEDKRGECITKKLEEVLMDLAKKLGVSA